MGKYLKYADDKHKHWLTPEEKMRGLKNRTKEARSLSRTKGYLFSNSLNCQNCRVKCFLYDPVAKDCKRQPIARNFIAIMKNQDPRMFIDKMIKLAYEMNLELYRPIPDEAKKDPLYMARFMKFEKLLQSMAEIFKLKFGEKYTITEEGKMTPSEFQNLYRDSMKDIEVKGEVVKDG